MRDKNILLNDENVVKEKFYYLSLVNLEKAPGVKNKIENSVQAAGKLGFHAKNLNFNTNFNGVISLVYNVLSIRSGITYFRYSDLVAPVFFCLMVILRLKGVKVIIEVPTPRVNLSNEVAFLEVSMFHKFFRNALNFTCGSWVTFPAQVIVQYANEGWWYRFGVNRKTMKIGNGVLYREETELVKSTWPDKTLRLVAVAQVAYWHGYDRILRALAVLRDRHLKYDISFTLIGDGIGLPYLQKLSNELGLDNVSFSGTLTGKDLSDKLDNMHIGIGSLGLYRKGLTEASSLKTREYMMRGLTVIDSGTDPDFPNANRFRIEVPNADEIDSLVDIIGNYDIKQMVDPRDVQKYAKENLSIESKLSTIIDRLG